MAGNNSRPKNTISQLYQEFVLYRQSSELQSKQRSEQLEKLEGVVSENHKSFSRQFDSVNTHLNALTVADGRLRSDLEHYIERHDAPKMLVRLEEAEKRITVLERRNDKMDGAAIAAKVLWFALGGILVGLAVAWLK